VTKWRRHRWAGHVARMRERKSEYRALVGKPEGRKPLGKPWRRWENNIKWIFEMWDGGHGLNRTVSGYGQVAGWCEWKLRSWTRERDVKIEAVLCNTVRVKIPVWCQLDTCFTHACTK
jgi:hypothetical protein